MSHVFISYAHDDQDKYQVLDKFLVELKKAGFGDEEIWYDQNLDPGSRWRNEIDTKLEEAFVIVVLLAPASMASPYVTYEWSWAIGNGTGPIPLLMYGSYDDTNFHLRLRDIHCVDCRKSIPAHVIEAIKDKKETPRDTEYLSRLILELVMPFRVRARLTLWLYPYLEADVISGPTYIHLMNNMLDEARELNSKKLPQFRLSYSHAFTSKQTKKCRELMRMLLSFWLLFYASPFGDNYVLSDYTESSVKGEKFRTDKLEVTISAFETGTRSDEIYKAFDDYLRAISKAPEINADLTLVAFGGDIAISWFLPEDEQEIIRQVIHDVRQYEINR